MVMFQRYPTGIDLQTQGAFCPAETLRSNESFAPGEILFVAGSRTATTSARCRSCLDTGTWPRP